MWLKVKLIVSFKKKSVHPSRAMSLAMHGALSTPSSSFSSVSVLQRLRTSTNPCADSQEPRFDGYTDPEPRTGYEPKKRIVDNQIIYEQEDKTCTEDNQITKIEGHVKSFSYNQSLLSSAQDSIESIATPQEADLDDEPIRALGFTTALAGARSKCGTIASLSL